MTKPRCENCNGTRDVLQFPTPEDAEAEHYFAHSTLDGCLKEAERNGKREALREVIKREGAASTARLLGLCVMCAFCWATAKLAEIEGVLDD